MTANPRHQLRQSLRRQRRQLSRQQQLAAARALDKRLTGAGILNRHRDIAVYIASDGEIDPSLFLQRALRMGVRCYLPVVSRDRQLHFVQYRRGDPLYHNRFRIPEPAASRRTIKVWALGAILMPLVGFDRHGSRLGMGGGFYDRSLSCIRRSAAMHRPRLIGLAHSCQEVGKLEVENWDIALTEIVTDREVITVTADLRP